MAIDFPNSPTNGQIYTVSDKSWIWDGTVWKAYGASLSPTVLKVDSTNSRVGINNQSPTYPLDVQGNGIVTRFSAGNDGIVLAGRVGGSSGYNISLEPTTLTASRSLTLPNASGTVALTSDPGLVFITSSTGSGVSTHPVSNCFSTTYSHYKIMYRWKPSTGVYGLVFRMRSGAGDDIGNIYNWGGLRYDIGTATVSGDRGQNLSYFFGGSISDAASGLSSGVIEIFNPNLAEMTHFTGQAIDNRTSNSYQGLPYSGLVNSTTQYTGFTVAAGGWSTGTLGTVTIEVYGYRKS